jgi:hypothetical protein
MGLLGLTWLGEHPAPVERLAAVIERPVAEAGDLAREHVQAHVEDGLIYSDEPQRDTPRRKVVVGDRELTLDGCAVGLFGMAAVLDVPFG